MKKILVLLCLSLMCFKIQSQPQEPVKWTASYKSLSPGEGEITIIANIDKNWHIYSQDATKDGPIPTSFNFKPSKDFQLLGKPIEIGAHEIFDKTFEAKISSFSDRAEFKQKIKLTAKTGFVVSFKVEFMCCNDMMCLPPKTVDLSIKVQ
jgi:thiol:disulfide interchange protein DsbD